MPQGVKTTVQGIDVEVAFYSPSIVRVYKTPEGSSYDKKSLVVMKEPEETFVEFAMNKEYIRLKSDALQVEVNSSTGGINFYDATGRVLLKDKDYGTQFTPFDDAGTFSYNVRQAFLLENKDSVFYHYKKLISLRKEYDVISKGNIEMILEEHNKVLAYTRNYENKTLVVLNNFYGEETMVKLPSELLCNEYKVNTLISNYSNYSKLKEEIILRPYESIVYYIEK